MNRVSVSRGQVQLRANLSHRRRRWREASSTRSLDRLHTIRRALPKLTPGRDMGNLKPTVQGFICFLTGERVRDNEIVTTTTWLSERAGPHCRTMVATVTGASGSATRRATLEVELLVDELAVELTGKTRLYLHGHGDHIHHTIGGWRAGDVAALLGKVQTSRIRVLACRAGRGSTELGALDVQLQNSVNGFAGQLCKALRHPGLEIHANMYPQLVRKTEDKAKSGAIVRTVISKLSRDETGTGGEIDRMAHSTVVFTLVGDSVMSEWKQHVKRV